MPQRMIALEDRKYAPPEPNVLAMFAVPESAVSQQAAVSQQPVTILPPSVASSLALFAPSVQPQLPQQQDMKHALSQTCLSLKVFTDGRFTAHRMNKVFQFPESKYMDAPPPQMPDVEVHADRESLTLPVHESLLPARAVAASYPLASSSVRRYHGTSDAPSCWSRKALSA
jgi:hypothetical protein